MRGGGLQRVSARSPTGSAHLTNCYLLHVAPDRAGGRDHPRLTRCIRAHHAPAPADPPLYGEFFGPAAIEHQLTLGLDGPPGPLVGIWVNRAKRDFSDDELLLAELLRPQLQAAELAAKRAVARAALTHREREVLHLVAAGATNAAVAEALVVSPGRARTASFLSYTRGELAWPSTWIDRSGHDRTPIIPCHEVSGIVASVVVGTSGLQVGDEVYGLTDWYRDGAATKLVPSGT